VIEHCLVKSPPDASRRDAVVRYASAVELHRDLAAIQAKPAAPRRTTLTRAAGIGVGLAIVLAAVAFGWLWRRSTRDRWVHETATPEIARLVEAGEFAKAVALVREARAVLPKDPTLEKFWVLATDDWSIDSDPGGAAVSMRPYRGDPDAWEPVGVAPLKHARIPKDVHVLRLTASGFAPLLVITGYGAAAIPPGVHGTFSAKWKLRPAERVPADMVAVPAGFAVLGFPYNMVAAPVDGFLIDRHEVSNEEYKKFVDARGYDRREFWKERFVRDGREIPWEQAMSSFRDATGRPGPSTWQVGSYAKGSERHPVAGVSWYEAAAYAEFAGKSLPTAYQWTVASESAYAPSAIAEGGNFRGSGTQPVGRPGTLSGFGTTDMAGNVKEWCLNEGQDGNRFILGGGFGDQTYQFAFTDEQPPWRRDANFGVRGVTLDAPLPAAALAKINSVSRDFSREKPLSDDVFRAYLRLYTYDKGELHARTEETETTDQWTREKVSFDAAYGNERVIAQVFLPKKVSPPFQAVVYFPGGFAMFDDKLDLANVENGLDYYMKSGRALIVPIYQSTYERRHGAAPDGLPPGLYRDVMIMWSKDLGRTLDYLETRKDIDGTRFAYAGLSLGAQVAPVLLAVEERFKAAILTSGGLMLRRDLAEVDRINFVTHVKTPVLMLNGRYDGEFPVESSQLPLFRRLGTPAKDKKHVVYEAGHANLPHAEEVRETLDWLDKYLGPVRH
jgi:dienelactone hydrolase